MSTLTRRKILQLFGGLVGGVFLTPVPWKLLKDASVMSQTGPWIAKLPRGPLSTGYSTCTLCTAGCGLRARCISGIPFSMSAVPHHPLSFGTLCAVGVAAHHSAYHPTRLRTPVIASHDAVSPTTKKISIDEAKSRLGTALKGADHGSIAILDLIPGRTTSLAYRKILGTNGRYILPSRMGTGTLDAMSETPYGPTGSDLEHAKLIVSFGAPLLDPWGNPSRLTMLPSGSRPEILQLETRRSRTATLANEWIRTKPGSETAFALGLANVIIRNNAYDAPALRHIAQDLEAYLKLIQQFSPERVSELTGVPVQRIEQLGRELVSKSPAIIVGCPNTDPQAEIAMMGLNILLGNLEREGGIISRKEVPVPAEFAEPALAPITNLINIPDHSIRVLIIDDPGSAAALPWDTIKRKLTNNNPFVACFTPFNAGIGTNADLLIPTPAHLESLAESNPAPHAMNASYALANPLLPGPKGIVDPVQILGDLFSVPGSTEQYLRGRLEAIRTQGEGSVFNYQDGSTTEVKSYSSADECWSKMTAGAVWINSTRPSRSLPRVSLLGKGSGAIERMTASALRPERDTASMNSHYPLLIVPFTYPGSGSVGQVSPLMTKVFQESGLRATSNIAFINPDTAQSYMLGDGDFAQVETALGSGRMRISIDRSAMPGVIQVAAGPDPVAFTNDGTLSSNSILSFVQADDACSWKPTPACLRKVS